MRDLIRRILLEETLVESRVKWTDDLLRQEALKYNILTDFDRLSSGASQTARRRGKDFFNDITSHMEKRIPWTEESIRAEALKHKTKGEFSKTNAWSAAKRMGILADVTMHMEPQGSRFKRIIYAYEFPDNHVYIGLTFNMQKRNNDHMNKERSSVFQHMKKTGLKPTLKTLTEFLDKDEAAQVEGNMYKDYENKGWVLLNKVKTGGLGGNVLKWTKEAIELEALKYDNIGDFYKNATPAIQAAKSISREFFNEITKNMSRGNITWTEEMLKDEALKYRTRSEFQKNSNNAYNSAYRKGKAFLDSITSHMDLKKRTWNEDTVRDEALKYPTITLFHKNASAAYKFAKDKGKEFFDYVTSHMKPKRTWNEDTVREEALKYPTITLFHKNAGAAYQFAKDKEKEFFNDITSHMNKRV